MTSSGGQGVGQSDPNLYQVTHKANEIEKLFDCLPAALQLEALDVLQSLVNSVMNRMTHGKVSSVRFVPVPAEGNSNQTTSAPEEAPKIQPKIEIKQEPIDDTWSSVPVSGHSIGMLQPVSPTADDPYPTTLHPNQLASPPLMTSTPKSKTNAKNKKTKTEKKDKKKAGKRLLPKLNDAEDVKKQKKSSGDNVMLPPMPDDVHEKSESNDVDIIDDSGIGDSVLDLSGGAVEELEHYDDAESFEECAPEKSPPGAEDTRDDPDYTVNMIAQSVRKVLSWSREAPKKRKQRDMSKLPFHCQHCKFATGRKYSLDTHMSLHTGDSKFKCTECDKCFTAASSLKRHVMIHEGVRPFNCPVCQKKFVDIAGLRTHSAVHTGERLFKCELCSKAYTNHANLARHKRVHTGEMPYVCKYENCDAKFRDLSSLKLHILKHTGEKPYSCGYCQKKFKTSSDFRRHERTHTQERNYKCTECGKTFIQGYHLKQHLKIHADLWLFHCDLCGKRFRTKASLQHHTKGHAGVKDHKCEKCNSAFTTKRYLNDHYIATHTNTKPYKCDVCQKSFNHISNMKRHKRMHSDEYRYKCKFCDRGFKYINSLQYHEGIHTGEKKICDKCGFTCRSISTMKAHRCGESPSPVKKTKQHQSNKLVDNLEDDEFEDEELELADGEFEEDTEAEEADQEYSDTEGSPVASENTSGEVEIVDVQEESESDESARKPRAAARKSGLMHTPRKSKQRAMKKLESIAEDLNEKPSSGLRIKLSGLDQGPKEKTTAKNKKSSQKPKEVRKVQSPATEDKHEVNKAEAINKNPETNGELKEIVETLAEKSKTDNLEVTVAKCNGSDNVGTAYKMESRNQEWSENKNSVAEHAVESNKELNSTEALSPKGQSLMEDISVMQEAYGSLATTQSTLTNTMAKSNASTMPNGFLGSGFEDLERCMPIIAQVYSVQGANR